MSQIAINTSQNVNIHFKLASIGERLLALIIDLLIMGAYVISLIFILTRLFNVQVYFDGLDDMSRFAIIILFYLPVFFYTLILESIMEGQTIGKKIMKIKVVKIDGYQASFGDYLIRWMFRLVDVFSNSGIIGLLSIIISKNNQRLGDMASGTAVVSLKNNVNISHTILENIAVDYVPLFPQVIALSDNDMRIIKSNYINAKNKRDNVIIHRLSDKIKTLLKIEPDFTQITEQQFIDYIIKDYNFYTGQEK